MTIDLLNSLCWGVFIVVWILGSIYNLYKAPHTIHSRNPFDWIIFAAAFFLVTHLQIISRLPHDNLSFLTFRVYWLQAIGVLLLALSTVFTLWSRLVLGKMWASHAQIKVNHQLVTNGPYRITRHPIYTGILGMALGSTFSLGQGLIFLGFIVMLLFFLNRVHNEEQMLSGIFGEMYQQYKRKVPQLIPFLKTRNH
jgi:protein-S-isoprenylcysteine O-methyltransferase Ste14